MAKTKLSALSPEEQLDVLSRVYIREVTKPINKWLSGSIRRAGGEYDAQLNMGKVKNMFLSGSMAANDFAYAVGNPKYETNRLSVMGSLYNYIYRSRIIDELKNNYSVDRGINRAYGYIRTYGYEEFYTFMKSAFVPTSPTSVIDAGTHYGQTYVNGYILDEEVSTGSISLEDFSKDQIKVIKEYMKSQSEEYMKARGFSKQDIEAVFSHIDRMRTTPVVSKSQTVVSKPSKRLEGFLISMPQPAITADPVPEKVVKPAPPKGMSQEEFDKRFIDPNESVIVHSAGDLEDEYRNPICMDQNGNFCYVDGTPFTGSVIKNADGSDYMRDGVIYDNGIIDEDEEDYFQVVDGVTYKNGHMMSDGGFTIRVEDGCYTDKDVEDTKLNREDKFKPYTGTQIEMDLGPKQ